jgi:hypothetical protein
MLSLKTSGLLSSALLIQSFVFQGAALELSQGELDGYLKGVAEFLMEEGERRHCRRLPHIIISSRR